MIASCRMVTTGREDDDRPFQRDDNAFRRDDNAFRARDSDAGSG